MAPGLLGFFGKRDKSNTPRKNAAEVTPGRQRPTASPASAKGSTSPSVDTYGGSQLSIETEYVLADAESPALPNSIYHLGSPSGSASSTKLKMPFRRRKQSLFSASASKVDLNDSTLPPLPPAKPAFLSSSSRNSSDSNSLHPPPSRSAIFAAYADSHSASSTRSLPQEQSSPLVPSRTFETMSIPDPHRMRSPTPPSPPPKPSKPSGGMFSWARSRDRTKSKPTPPPAKFAVQTPPPVDASSFNLKSFRHVTSPSPSPSPIPDRSPSPLPSYVVPPARPRPRGESAASDSSQRISVAAFREAQARRSTANSPVPSALGDGLKAESPYLGARRSPSGQPPERGRQRSSTVGSPNVLDYNPMSRLPVPRVPPTRSSTAPLFSSAPLTSSDESEEDESESEEDSTLRPSRKRTITRATNRAQSELGHRSQPSSSPFTSPSPSSSPQTRAPASASGHTTFLEARPRPQAGLVKDDRTPSVYSRTRASVSTSALVPDAAAKRASLIAQQSASALRAAAVSRARPKSVDSTSSESSSSGSSDDLPLAAFAMPQRPSSAASSASRGRMPSKPLIDISSLTGGNQPLPRPTAIHADSGASAGRPTAEIAAPAPSKAEDAPFKAGARPRKTSLGLSERLTQLAAAAKPPAPPSSSDSKSPDPSHVGTKPTAPLRSNLKVDTARPPPSAFSPAHEPESPPIVPTPIRERPTAPAFAVTSRPTSHASSSSIGTITALEKIMASEPEPTDVTAVRMVRSSQPSGPRESSLPRPSPKSSSSGSRGPTTTLVSRIPHNDVTSSAPPPKPFSGLLRNNSPASSGDSSSVRMPVTPRDGSELGAPANSRSGGRASAGRDTKSEMGEPVRVHRKRASVSFLDEQEGEREGRERERDTKRSQANGKVDASKEKDAAEQKRRERRRSEAKNAIELGKVINGKAPILDDDDEESPMDVPRMSRSANSNHPGGMNMPFPASATMGFPGQWGPGVSPAGTPSAQPSPFTSMPNLSNMNLSMGMGMDMNMNTAGMDPRMIAAHQQAMFIAKQTYQMAVAQQAMRDAADEWERGSSVSGWGGGRSSVAPSVMGMPNMAMGMGGMNGNMGMFPGGGFGMGMGSGGSVIGSGGSVMNGGGGMGMGMGWPQSAGMMYPPAPRSMYAGSVYAGSEVGGPGWGSRSAYGGDAPAPRDRSSRVPRMSAAPPPLPTAKAQRDGPRPRTKTAPSSGGQGQGQGPRRGEGVGLVGAVSPPSSWKGPS
ncbi:hypothetical protein FA95DRAFT_1607529 [Auriscalpium vulgare]|uniref:Uncharacterized protein n=1 Tax=Auriscalpium vulgare TaxID=40419 RepID=A0ACB8RNC9_9AGAM|nr:hypothetical protein FA95DRAFT_1607529 [Auriscalpium vulgare]